MGETARTTFERGLEHERDRVAEKDSSHMHQHIQEEHAEHPGQVGFAMKVIRSHKSALNRQINEAVLIANYGEKNLLNSKFEYNRCILPRITVLAAKEKEKVKEISDYESLENDVTEKDNKRRGWEGGPGPQSKRRRRWKQEPRVHRDRKDDSPDREGEMPPKKKRRKEMTKSKPKLPENQQSVKEMIKEFEEKSIKLRNKKINEENKEKSMKT